MQPTRSSANKNISVAELLLINLEDLWFETRQQNVPGTVNEHANWQRRAKHSVEEFDAMKGVGGFLREIDRLRRSTRPRRMPAASARRGSKAARA